MIDDATLAAWEQHHRHIDEWGYALQMTLNLCVVCLAITEIRRLREEVEQCHSDAGFVIPALRESLAAHQAVVRELAKVLHPFTFPTEFEGSFIVMGRDVNRARQILTHPLVQRALGEKA